MVPADGRPSRRVQIAARLITALISLAGAEGVLWFAGYPNWWAMDAAWGGGSPDYEADADLGWRVRQGDYNLVWADGTDRNHPTKTTNWSGGRRATSDHEPTQVSVSQGRVLFFGDSYIQGYGLSDSETLPWIFQKRHPELNVSNFGSGLYGTYQSYLSMKKSVHEPASVYYLFNSFHEDRNAAAPSFLRIAKKPPPGWFYPYAEVSQGQLVDERSGGELIWPISRHWRLIAMVQDYDLLAKSYWRMRGKKEVTQILLAKMDETVRVAGAKLRIILMDMTPEERNDYRHFLESRNIAFIDCDRPETRDRSLRLSDGLHPTGKLNEMIARWIDPASGNGEQVVAGK